MADESHQNISGLLTEAMREYLRRRRVRPIVRRHLEDSIVENEKLGRFQVSIVKPASLRP